MARLDSRARVGLGAAATALALAWVVAPASAQTTPPPADVPRPFTPPPQELELRERLERQQPPRSDGPRILRDELDPNAVPGAADVSFMVSGVEIFDGTDASANGGLGRLRIARDGSLINGQLAIPAAEIEALVAPLRGRTATLADLLQLGQDIRRAYEDAGFGLVSVRVPPQEITSEGADAGVVRLVVTEGTLRQIIPQGVGGDTRRQVMRYLTQIQAGADAGEPVNLKRVERFLLLANDLPGVSVRASLKRGVAAGEVDMVVDIRLDRLTGQLSLQNLASKPLGRWGVLAGVDYNGPVLGGRLDQVSVFAYNTLNLQEQQIVQVGTRKAIGANGTVVGGRVTAAWSEPGSRLADLDLQSETLQGEVEVSHPIIRSRRTNLRATAGFQSLDQITDGLNNQTLSEDQTRVVYARADAQWRRPLADGRAGLEVRQGLEILGATSREDANKSRLDGNARAFVVRADADVNRPLCREGAWLGGYCDRVSAHLRVNAQWTDEALLSPEEYAIGNQTIGRGYDPAILTGDKAFAFAAEVRARVFTQPVLRRVEPFVFYDNVWVANEDEFSQGARTVDSAGVGLRIALGDRNQAQLNLTYARPMRRPFEDPALGERPDAIILATLTTSLF